jgi:hypothetical protein
MGINRKKERARSKKKIKIIYAKNARSFELRKVHVSQS